MHGHAILQWIEPTLGALLVLLVLLDVFLTVLYARIGTGIISDQLARITWRCFLLVSKLFRNRATALSFCGPGILVLLVAVWTLLLTCGTALIFHPYLGTSIRASNGATPTDFITAMFAGGSSLAIVGSSDFVPQTGAFRMLYLLISIIGISVVSLTLTYLMQIYTALQRRNALAMNIHLLTSKTGDAAELIAGIGPQGQFTAGYTNLAALSQEMTNVEESHHFYPVLFYFRFHKPYYSVSRSTLVALDAVTLLKSGMDEHNAWLANSASVSQLWQASLLLVTTLESTFVPGGLPQPPGPPDGQTRERWRRRYFAGLRRLRQAGIQTIVDEQAGAEEYVSLRVQWDTYIAKLAPSMAYGMDEIDCAGHDPGPA